MKKIIVSLMLAAAVFSMSDANAARNSEWGAFGFASDVELADTGIGGGVFGRLEYVDNIFFTGRALVATYDDFERGQILLGGEWVDRNRQLLGYVGLQAGADILSGSGTDTTDAFARIYYDLGWRYTSNSEMRIGIAMDALNDALDRQWGVRAGWYTNVNDDSEGMSFFVSGEAYDNETNVFVGVTF